MSNEVTREQNIADAWASIGTAEGRPSSDLPPPLPSFADMTPPAFGSQVDGVTNQSLAQSLQEKGYHPVMLFGSTRSGKSYLLASLFHYLQNDPWSEAICLMGEWILPVNTAKGAKVADEASKFFNHVVMDFNSGNPVPSTHTEVPFFIPVILRPNNGMPDIKLAFMESRGEDYHIKPDTVNFFPELKQDILDVYRNYPLPISLLVIAPYTLRDAYTEYAEPEDPGSEEFKFVDKSLFGALQAYQANRVGFGSDHYLFVLTKWDVYTGGASNPEFLEPPVGLVEKLIADRYTLAWNIFRGMRKTANSNTMQYCAGLISGNHVYSVPEALKPKINRFPRALWDWMYINASGGKRLYGPKRTESTKGVFGWLKKILS